MPTNFFKDFLNSLSDTFSDNSEGIAFYELEKVTADFLKSNQSKGLKNPLHLELLISKNEEGVKVKFTAYYKGKSNNFVAQDKLGQFKGITGMPKKLKDRLEIDKELKIKIEDIISLLSEQADENLYKINFKDIEKLADKFELDLQKENWVVQSRKVLIEDKIFKTGVQIKYEVTKEEKKELKIKGNTYIEVTDLPNELVTIIETSGEVEIEI